MAGKRDKIKDSSRFSILVPSLDRCMICGSSNGIALHEVFEGNFGRPLSKEEGLVAPLCNAHHDIVHRGDGRLNKYLKQKAERIWIKHNNYNYEEGKQAFIQLFGKNYLDVED